MEKMDRYSLFAGKFVRHQKLMKMKKLMLACIIFLSACTSKITNEEKVKMAGLLIEQLQDKAEYSDSLKVAVFLLDETAQDNLVKIPGGGYGFSKQYKEKIGGNKELARLVDKCNVSVLAYGTFKKHVAKELIEKVPGSEGDSLRQLFLKLR